MISTDASLRASAQAQSVSALLRSPGYWLAISGGAAACAAVLVTGVPLWLVVGLAAVGGAAVVGAHLTYQNPTFALYAAVVVLILPPALLPGLLSTVAPIACLGAWWWADHAPPHAGRLASSSGRRPSATVTWMAALVAIHVLSLLWAENLSLGRATLLQYVISLGLLAAIVAAVDSLAELMRLMRALAVAGWTVMAAAVVSAVADGLGADDRLSVFGLNANTVSTLLILLSPGVLWPFALASVRGGNDPLARRKRLRALWVAAGYLVGSLMVTGLTGSRGGLLAFALLLMLLGWGRATRVFASLGIVMALATVVVAPGAFATAFERFRDPGEGVTRFELWRAAGLLITEHPLGGVGVGGGPDAMAGALNQTNDIDRLYKRTSIPAHNPFLEVAVDAGLPALVAFGMAVATAGLGFLALLRRVRGQRLAMAAYGAVVGPGVAACAFTWVKSGGMAFTPITALMLALLVVPVRAMGRPSLRQLAAFTARPTRKDVP